MKAFKGFNKDLTCRGYQYEEGKEFHTERAECCDTGFHACEYPLDCFGYYDPAHSVYHEVELSGEMDKSGDNTKVCATDIKIGARLSIAGLVKMAIDFTMSKVNKEAGSDERHGFASATGYKGASSVSDPTGVEIVDTVSKLDGKVDKETLLSLLPFIDNPKEVLEKLEADKERDRQNTDPYSTQNITEDSNYLFPNLNAQNSRQEALNAQGATIPQPEQ